jgi:hypothetical protein
MFRAAKWLRVVNWLGAGFGFFMGTVGQYVVWQVQARRIVWAQSGYGPSANEASVVFGLRRSPPGPVSSPAIDDARERLSLLAMSGAVGWWLLFVCCAANAILLSRHLSKGEADD